MVYRRTLRREVACTGIGLHCGRPVRLRLVPAPAEHGIRFVRTDVGVEIPATLAHIGSQDHATTLQPDGVSIGTVEHLLAALLRSRASTTCASRSTARKSRCSTAAPRPS